MGRSHLSLLLVLACWGVTANVCAQEPEPKEEKPAAAPEPAGAAEEVIHLGAVERVTLYPKQKRIEVKGEVQVQKGQIEVAACARGGKTHESLFLIKARPRDLNAALLWLDCKFVSGPASFGDGTKPVGTRVIVEVEWEAEGEKVRKRVEDLAWDARLQTSMPRIAWVYVGSKKLRDPRTGQKVFAADRERNLITTLHDPLSLLDNPLPSGGDNTAGRYMAHADVLPPRGTPLTVHLRVATKEEIAASEAVEAKAAEADAAYRKQHGDGPAPRTGPTRQPGGGQGK
ncbi:MAG: YdjY domain-containing protein [Planctomycetota bacterium]|jgi:hypothetical protein